MSNTSVHIGDIYGKLTIIERMPNNKHRKAVWKCQCTCGNICIVAGAELRKGDTTSCGCAYLDMGKDFIGVRVGKLAVIDKVYNRGSKKWKCLCDCGKTKFLSSHDLDGIRYNSCGCLSGIPRISNLDRIINSRYKAYRANAKKKGRIFSLTVEEFKSIVISPCYYCGDMDKRDYKRGKCKIVGYRKAEDINGIDRLDSSRGYDKDNIVPCCRMCNKMKMEFSLDNWLSKIVQIYNRRCHGVELGCSDTRREE